MAMQILVDGTDVREDFVEGTSVEHALRQVQAHLGTPSRLVIGIRCNGRDIPSDELPAILRSPVAEVTQLEVFTSTVEGLVVGAMQQASLSLQESEANCRQVAELLAGGKTTEGIRLLGVCLGAWQQIHEAVAKSIQLLSLDAECLTINDEPLARIIGRPKEVLMQIKQALHAHDHVLLADVLQYEFGEVTEQWYSLISQLKQAAEDRGDGGTGPTESDL
jgi:hypothetical protein